MFGRQLNSFEAEIQLQSADLQKVIDANGSDKCPGVFIRAPAINKLLSPEVLKLGSLTDGTIVAVQYHNIIATCFHPELTSDLRWHLYFIECILKQRV
jgi:5'-phosphate synthase pdxT subunit